MWHILSKEQLILFSLVPFLYHVCHALPSTLQLKMTMSLSTFCKFLPNNAMVWLQRMSHLMRGDLFPFWKFVLNCNFSSWSWWSSFGRIWHELMDVWAIIWLWWDKTSHAGYADIAVSLAVKSVVDMLKMGVHKRTRAENNPTNHYQSKVWYLAMVTQTFKCNFSTSCLITRHSSIWITNDCIHCSHELTKLAKSGIWLCHLQWQCTRSCVTWLWCKNQ